MLIVSCGATTAVGLTAAQTCAATRARISGFEQVVYLAPPAEPVSVARVPAAQQLKRSPGEWLVNMAVLALRDCVANLDTDKRNIALILSLPDAHRGHPAFSKFTSIQFLEALQKRVKVRFHPLSCTLNDGHAAVIKGIAVASELFDKTGVDYCIVGGVDSLLNHQDIARLKTANRLHDKQNSQGVIPGEGAGFVVFSRPGLVATKRPIAQLLGFGISEEKETILGESFSTGVGLRNALVLAAENSACPEPQFSFRVSDMNGERYRAWESLICSTRYYRTRRDQMPVWYPATSVGDLGAAAGVLTLIVAALGISRGYSPGPYGVCETSSDNGLRAACVLAPAPDLPTPPFRSKAVWIQ